MNATEQLQASLPLAAGVRVIAADGGLVAFEKPCGVRTHPNDAAEDGAALLRARYDAAQRRYAWRAASAGAPAALWMVNRLDAPTSGVVLGALDAETADAARAAFAAGRVDKVYYALVKGRPRPPVGCWRDFLGRERACGGVRAHVGGALSAIADYVWRGASARVDGVHLLRLAPKTGRTHQLRVQCALHGVPILGDRTYGDFEWNKRTGRACGERRLFLHCAATRVRLETPSGGRVFSAQCPPPESFAAVMGAPLRLGK